jgi:hypothetical protein
MQANRTVHFSRVTNLDPDLQLVVTVPVELTSSCHHLLRVSLQPLNHYLTSTTALCFVFEHSSACLYHAKSSICNTVLVASEHVHTLEVDCYTNAAPLVLVLALFA